MFARQLIERFTNIFSGYREDKDGPFTAELAEKFLHDFRRVRNKDYIFSFGIDGTEQERTITTTCKWFFILTNAAVWFDAPVKDWPDIKLVFPDCVATLPFSNEIKKAGEVPAALAFGREGAGRFEEYRNLYYVLGDQINVQITVKPHGKQMNGSVLLCGVELDLEGVDNG